MKNIQKLGVSANSELQDNECNEDVGMFHLSHVVTGREEQKRNSKSSKRKGLKQCREEEWRPL